MLKKVIIVILSFSIGFANEIVYSQGNPPRQSEVSRKRAVSVNSDLFISQIEEVFNPKFLTTEELNTQSTILYTFPNTPKLGFGAGFGIALNDYFNISFQYRYLRSGGDQIIETKKDANLNVDIMLPIAPISETDLSAFVKARDTKHLYIVDVLLLMSKSLTSKILIQPFVGFITLRHNNTQTINAYNLEDFAKQAFSQRRLEQTSSGILIGSDIRFLINQTLYFFASLKTSLTSRAKLKITTHGFNDFGIDPIHFSEITYNSTQNIQHRWIYRFGFAFNHVFDNNWLISLRIFTEMHSFLFENYAFGGTIVF